MKTKLTLTALALLLLVAAPVAAQAGLQALRDDANGYLCYDFRAWGQCFAYTPTAGMPVTAAPSATTAPGVTPAPPTATRPPATATAPASSATPTATRPPATATATSEAPAVVLLNPSFDEQGGWVDYFLQTSAAGKMPTVYQASRGDGPFAGMVFDGPYSHHFRGEYLCWQGGSYQRVPVPSGRWIRFGMSAFTWSNSTDFFEFATDPNTWQTWRVGIDPLGGADPRQSRVEWVGADGSDEWRRLTVETIARNSFVTVFAEFNLGYKYPGECMWPVRNNWGVLDAGTLEVLP